MVLQTTTLIWCKNSVLMQSSHRLLSRLLHPTKRNAVSNPSLVCSPLYNDNGVVVVVSPLLHFTTTTTTTTTTATDTDQKKIFKFVESSYAQVQCFSSLHAPKRFALRGLISSESDDAQHHYSCYRNFWSRSKKQAKGIQISDEHSQRAVKTALCGNFLVFALKFGVWTATSSQVMLAEVVHSVADFANQALLAYGLISSRRAPDAIHPYGYSKERFVWSLISAVGIFCLGSGATIVSGIQHLWSQEQPVHIEYAALVIGGSLIIEGASLIIAIQAVKKGAAAEGMKVRDYIWRGHDPTSVAVMTEDSAAVTGLIIAGASLVAVNITGNPIYDAVGSIIVGNLLGLVAIFLIQRNRHALIGRAMDDNDMDKILHLLKNDPVVDSLYDCKSEVIGPGFFRFKAEIDFNGERVVQNYLERSGSGEWAQQFRKAAMQKDDSALVKTMADYGEELVTALGSEVDRLEREIQEINPGIRHVDIEVHNPADLS